MTTLNTSVDYLRTPAASTTTTTTTGSTGASSMGMNDFLKLLTTQMQTQDPFNPVDNTQMVAQMAQFSSVAGISSMNTTLSGIASNLDGSSRIGDAASWIGKSVLVAGKTASALSSGAYAGQVSLPSDATDVTLSFVDASGKTVHSESLGAQTKGDFSFAWDGKDDSGNAVTGPVTVQASAKGTAGTIAPTLSTWTDVTGVQSPAGGTDAKLITGLGLIAPADALSLA